MWFLLGVTTIVMAATIVWGSDRLFAATLWAYSAAGLCFLVFVISVGQRVRRKWAEASQPAFDLAGALEEPGVIVRRRSRASQAGFIGVGVVFAGLAINLAFEPSSPLFVRFISAGLFVALRRIHSLVRRVDARRHPRGDRRSNESAVAYGIVGRGAGRRANS